MRKICAIVTFALVLIGAAPQSVKAQGEESGGAGGCGSYGVCFYGNHTMSGPSGDSQNQHGGCLYCIAGWLTCHPGCLDAALPEDRRAAYKMAFVSAGQGDVHGMLSVMPAIPDLLSINAERGAVQLLACAGDHIVASLPLPRMETLTARAMVGLSAGQIKSSEFRSVALAGK